MDMRSALGQVFGGVAAALGREDGRCGTCRGWRDQRIEYPDPDDGHRNQYGVLAEMWQERFDLPEDPPAEWPSCGWRPTTLRIVYDDVERGTGVCHGLKTRADDDVEAGAHELR
jgi:hypothetical protein